MIFSLLARYELTEACFVRERANLKLYVEVPYINNLRLISP